MTTFIYLHPHHAFFTFLVTSSDFEATAKFLLDSFVILYSEYRSNNHIIEESVILNWNDYLADSKGNPVCISDIVYFIQALLNYLQLVLKKIRLFCSQTIYVYQLHQPVISVLHFPNCLVISYMKNLNRRWTCPLLTHLVLVCPELSSTHSWSFKWNYIIFVTDSWQQINCYTEKRMLSFQLRSLLLQLHQYDVSPIQSCYKANTSVTQ